MCVRTINPKFSIVIKVKNDDYIKREVTTNIIDKKEELFLCGWKTLTEWKIAVFFEKIHQILKETGKRVSL